MFSKYGFTLNMGLTNIPGPQMTMGNFSHVQRIFLWFLPGLPVFIGPFDQPHMCAVGIFSKGGHKLACRFSPDKTQQNGGPKSKNNRQPSQEKRGPTSETKGRARVLRRPFPLLPGHASGPGISLAPPSARARRARPSRSWRTEPKPRRVSWDADPFEVGKPRFRVPIFLFTNLEGTPKVKRLVEVVKGEPKKCDPSTRARFKSQTNPNH